MARPKCGRPFLWELRPKMGAQGSDCMGKLTWEGPGGVGTSKAGPSQLGAIDDGASSKSDR